MKEAQILQMLSGAAKEAGIVYLHTSFQENYRFKVNDSGVAEPAIFIVMEYLAGATALDYVNDEITAGHYQLENVNDAGKKNLLRQMTKLLLYLHAHNFVHLDFTLENLMFRDSQVVAIDFGLGQYCAETFDVGIFSGKRIYLPPETYSTNPTYDGRKRDIWSLGVCCYTLYSGRYLINSDDRVEDICLLLKKGLNSFLQIHYPLGLSWPDELKDFMSLCLNVNPHKRPTIEELLTHPWIKEKETSSSKFFSRVGKSIKNAVNNLLHTRNSIFVRSKKAAPTSATVTPIMYNRNINEPNNTNQNNNSTTIEQPPSLRKTILVNNNSPNSANRARISSFDDSPTASPGTKEFHRTIRNMKNVNGITVVNSPSQFNRVLQFAQKEGSNSPSPSHTPPSRTREVKIKRMSNSTTESDSVVSENSHSPAKPPLQQKQQQQPKQQPKQEEPPPQPPQPPQALVSKEKEKTTTSSSEGENKTKTIDINPSKDSKNELHTAIEHKPSVGSTVDLNSLISAHSNASKQKENEKSKTMQVSSNVKSDVDKEKEVSNKDKVKADSEESPDSVIPIDTKKEKSKNTIEKVIPVNKDRKSVV